MMKKVILYFSICLCCIVVHAQEIRLDKLSSFNVVNRKISINDTGRKVQIHLGAAEGDGIAWVKGASFVTGTIEFDVKGKDVLQQSFVGIAFHGLKDSSFDPTIDVGLLIKASVWHNDDE